MSDEPVSGAESEQQWSDSELKESDQPLLDDEQSCDVKQEENFTDEPHVHPNTEVTFHQCATDTEDQPHSPPSADTDNSHVQNVDLEESLGMLCYAWN